MLGTRLRCGARVSTQQRVAIGAHHQHSRKYVAVRQGKPAPKSIAVLGGGLTGLSAAYYITRCLPNAKVTLYEATERLGGWIDTETVEVKTPEGVEGQVQFERGARSVKAPRRGGGEGFGWVVVL